MLFASGTVGSKPISALEDVAVEQGNLYSVDVNKRVKLQRDKLSISNGLGWTKDNKTMFFIDSYVNKVWAYDFDLEKGVISTIAPPLGLHYNHYMSPSIRLVKNAHIS